MPTRVLHVSWEYPPLVYGGLGRYVDALSRAQAAAGDDVTVLTGKVDLRDGALSTNVLPPGGDEVWAGVRVLRSAPASGRAPSAPGAPVGPGGPGDLLASTGALEGALLALGRDAVRPGTVDVVQSHDWMTARAGRALATYLGAAWVHAVHATEHGRRAGRLDGRVPLAVHDRERSSVHGPDAVLVCSRFMATEVQEVLGAPEPAVHVVGAAVEAGRWAVSAPDALAARRRWADGVPLLVAVGRLEWEKGMSTLLRAVPAVAPTNPGVRVVLAGEGSYRSTLRSLAEELSVDVSLPGRLPDADLAALLAAADVVVVPSRYEPFGLVALEAQAAGACVVVTSTGGLADSVLDGRTGRTVGAGDVDALAQVLTRLLADPAERGRLARAGRQAAAARTWARTAGQVDGVYRSLRPGQ